MPRNTSYPQTRTRTNPGNRNQFLENLKEFAQNPDLVVFKNVKIRDRLGRVDLCPVTNRVIDIATEVPNADRIIKAQPVGEVQKIF